MGEITLTTELQDSVNVDPVLSPNTGPGYTDVIPVSGLYQVYFLTSSASHVYIRVILRQYQPEQIGFRLACVSINLNSEQIGFRLAINLNRYVSGKPASVSIDYKVSVV